MSLKKLGFLASLFIATLPIKTFGSDLSFYGGQRLNDFTDTKAISASLGIDIPNVFFGPFSPNQIRGDASFLFADFVNPPERFRSFIDANAITQFDVDVNSFALHAGPGWRFEILEKLAIVSSVQAGVIVSNSQSESLGPAPTDFDTFSNFTQTDFSYQFPVGIEYGFSKRFGLVARYRGLGIRGNGSSSFSSIVEGGIVFRF